MRGRLANRSGDVFDCTDGLDARGGRAVRLGGRGYRGQGKAEDSVVGQQVGPV
jgi:hypothetical protein